MAYNDLTRESGGDEKSRVDEAIRIVKMLEEHLNSMTRNERAFVEQMADTDYCTTKQIFWLRDIKAKYAE